MWLKRVKTVLASLLLVTLACQAPAQAVEARGTLAPMRGWLRATISYDYDEGITKLNDKRITFARDWGTRQEDGWYYYGHPVSPGDSICFIEGVTFPTTWTEELEGKEFSINITVEVAEIASDNESGWNENTQACYSMTFPFFSNVGMDEKATNLWNGRLRVDISEYEMDEDGDVTPYKNDKLIIPGQFVSKIVMFDLKKTFIRHTGDSLELFFYAGAAAAAAGLLVLCARKKGKEGEEAGK